MLYIELPISVMNDRGKNSSYIFQLYELMDYAGQKSSKKIKVYDPSYTVKILVADFGSGFSQLVPEKYK